MRTVLRLAPIVLLFTVLAEAQKLEPRAWPQEPASFLGIQLGKPMRESVRECPWEDQYGHKSYRWYETNAICFEQYGVDFIIYNVPTFYKVYATEVNGTVEDVAAIFKAANAPEVAQALAEKFGGAHLDAVKTVQNSMGASFDDHVLIWKGPNAEIDFDSVGSKVDEGSVAVYTTAYVWSLDQNLQKQKTAIKGVL